MKPQTNAEASKAKKIQKDHHRKVDGRDRRVLLPIECAKVVFALKTRMGHKTTGETVEWLIRIARPSIASLMMPSPRSPPMNPYQNHHHMTHLNASHVPHPFGVMNQGGFGYQMPPPPTAPWAAPGGSVFPYASHVPQSFHGFVSHPPGFAFDGIGGATPMVQMKQQPRGGLTLEDIAQELLDG